MKSILELELELANAKLAKMTSTVKQLGTKLSKANEALYNAEHELSHYKVAHRINTKKLNEIAKSILTVEESHQRAIGSIENKPKF